LKFKISDKVGATLNAFNYLLYSITIYLHRNKPIHQSEIQFRSVIENAVEGITITNESGEVITWNKAMKHITGIHESQTIGKNIWDVELLLEPEKLRTDSKRKYFEKELKEILNKGNSSGNGRSTEREYVSEDGKSLFLKRTLNAVKTEKGYILVTTIEDITERKNAEQALSESEKRYRQLLEVAPVGIAVHQGDKIVFCNPASLVILGANSKEQIIGKRIEEIIYPDNMQETLSRIAAMLRGDKNLYPVDNVYQKLDGTPVDVEVMAAPIIYKEKPAVQVIVVDITERKRVEAQLQKLMNRLIESEELMRKSASQQLHDQVGQNLTALTINLSFMQTQLSEESKNRIQKRLTDSLSILDDTIEQIRNIMVELQPPVLEDYGLSSAISWSLNKFEERTKIKTNYTGKDFIIRLSYSKEAALFRVFQEILHNIAKHSGAKNVYITLEEKRDMIILIVKDDGKGFNVNEVLQKKERDSFGLITMHERINFIGGKINILSGTGEGTTIEIMIGR
jgi:PAS domain S-box-containing protein